MLPIIFSVGPVSVSSFGLLLAIGFLAAVFVSWRIAKAYDIDESKIFDIAILTFFGALLFARAYFVLAHINIFTDFSRVLDFNRYPGLSFWGGLLGGIVVLRLLTIRAKLNFWQVADFASVSLLLGLVFGSLGCFLGGCGYGVVSNSSFAFPVIGLLGKRLPISLWESLIFLLFFWFLWKQAIRFHFQGKIFALFLFLLGVDKFITEYFRGDSSPSRIIPYLAWGQVQALLLIALSFWVFYSRSKRSFINDLKVAPDFIFSSKRRGLLLHQMSKSCYNLWISWKVGLSKTWISSKSWPAKLRRKINVKPTPRQY